jgi:acyl carrier protein
MCIRDRDFLKGYLKKENKNELCIKTLYYDILNADSIEINHSLNPDYDRIYLQTGNSLYHLISPYVIWYVSKNRNSLIRIESPFKIKLPDENAFFLDKFKENVKIFKILRKNGKDLIFILAKKPVYFEMTDKNFSNNLEKNSTNTSNNNFNNTNGNTNNYNAGSTALPTF